MEKQTTNQHNPSLLFNPNPKPNPNPKEDAASPRKHLGVGVGVGGGGGGGDRLKRDEWSEGAVSCLLEAYESKWILRNRAKLKGHDWEDVARHVSSRADSSKSSKTQTQCKNKIESMKKRYRSESAAADAASSWPLYHRLDLLLRGSTAPPQPPLLQQSSPVIPTPLLSISGNPTVMLMETSPPVPPPALLLPPPPPPPPPLSFVVAQNSHESNGVHRIPKEDEDATKPPEHFSDKNENNIPETDSSTPALYSEKEKPRPKPAKMKKSKKKRRTTAEELDQIVGSIQWLAEVVVRTEETTMEMMRDIERMRAEAEAKRGEMDLKRTEIIAKTQLEIAKIFAAGSNSSPRIGRSSERDERES